MAGIINRKLGLFTEQRTYPFLTLKDLRSELFEKARQLMRSVNSQHPWLNLTDEELLKMGGFYSFDSNAGKRALTLAAVLMFGKDEVIQEIVPGYKFDCLLRRQNIDRYDDRLTIRTNLIDAYDLMMEFVNKHLNDPFYLEGDMRISLRDKIFREAVSNIISHREYASPVPARLIIYRDSVILDNPSVQHHFGEITPENLKPFSKNPIICKFMIQLGRFDELGSGVTNIYKYLPLYANGAKPIFKETATDFELFLPLDESAHVTIHNTIYVASQLSRHVERLLLALKGEMTRAELMNKLGVTSVRYFRKGYLQPALKENLIEMTLPNKPRSIKQKYRLSKKGTERLKLSDNIGSQNRAHVKAYVDPQVTPYVKKLLTILKGEMSAEELQKILLITDKEKFKKLYLQPALQENLIEMTIPDKPGSLNPKYKLTEKGRRRLKTSANIGGDDTPQATPYVTPQVKQLLQVIEGEMTRKEIQGKLGLADGKHFREKYLQPALKENLVEMTIPDKPKSSKQKYRLTEKGKILTIRVK